MSYVTQSEVSDMQRLIDVMNGMSDTAPTASQSQSSHSVPRSQAPAAMSDAADMKRILESFYGAAGDAITETAEVATHDRNLKEAMSTYKTTEGVVIGSWEVRVKLVESAGSKKKTYNVTNPVTEEVPFKDLYIGEAAHAIVRYLNKGLNEDHVKIQEIADLEETYRRNRQDAMIFKKRYERCMQLEEHEAGGVFGARHQRSKALAIVAQDQIKTILDNIR